MVKKDLSNLSGEGADSGKIRFLRYVNFYVVVFALALGL